MRSTPRDEIGEFVEVTDDLLPTPFRVSDKEGQEIWGKGLPRTLDNNTFTKNDNTSGGGGSGNNSCQAMASYKVHSLLVNLHIFDTPVSYAPPIGPTAVLQLG